MLPALGAARRAARATARAGQDTCAANLASGRGMTTMRARLRFEEPQGIVVESGRPPVARQFAVSFDYRCPFARNAHESVVAGLEAGRDWDVTFVPFSLDQIHVEEGEPAVWERDPSAWGTGVNALTCI